MKNIIRKLLAVTAVIGIGMGVALVAEAGTYWNSTNCNHATAGNRICVDISA